MLSSHSGRHPAADGAMALCMKHSSLILVSALGVLLSACQSLKAKSFLPEQFTAFGTEPFWNADIADGQLTYITPDDYLDGQQGTGMTVAVTRVDRDDVVELSAMLDGAALQIIVTPGPCSDGMSDVIYPWSVERQLGDRKVQGCARRSSE